MGGGGRGEVSLSEFLLKGDILNREKFELKREILPFLKKIVWRFLKFFARCEKNLKACP
jgi:hypothetical protein